METGTRSPEETPKRARAPAATAAGCWCRRCGALAPARASCRAIIQLKLGRGDGKTARSRTARTCMPGPKCSFPARAGSGSIRPPGLLAGEGHIPLVATRITARRADHRHGRARGDAVLFEMDVARVSETPRVTQPFSDDAWAVARCARRGGRPRSRRGDVRRSRWGRADIRVGRRLQSPEWTTAALGGEASARALTSWSAPARALRAAGAAALRPPENGIPAKPCRAGPTRITGGATASRSGATQA